MMTKKFLCNGKAFLSLLSLLLFLVFTTGCEKGNIFPQDRNLPTNRCEWEPDPGPCEADMTRYYFDKEEGKCKPFSYGGCHGVVPFETMEECLTCQDSTP